MACVGNIAVIMNLNTADINEHPVWILTHADSEDDSSSVVALLRGAD